MSRVCQGCGQPIDPTTQDYLREELRQGRQPRRLHEECDLPLGELPLEAPTYFTHDDPRPWHREDWD